MGGNLLHADEGPTFLQTAYNALVVQAQQRDQRQLEAQAQLRAMGVES